MPDRSLRLLTLPPQPRQGGERGAVLLRERPASPPDAPSGGNNGDGRGGSGQDGNPFAPPPEGTPDRPWQPRHPSGSDSGGNPSGQGQGSGEGDAPGEGGGYTPWGSQWSDRQPGRSPGGFGERPQRPGGGPEGPGGGRGPGMRWDPTDPAQRRARYALLSGMWAFFFVLFGWQYVALLLGALALYWGISALRTKPRRPDPNAAPVAESRPQTTAAVSGLVTASLAIALVATNFAAQFAYRDYYTCVNDALTSQAKQSCDQHLPRELRGVLGVGG
ncbi:hypothetical protein GCM10014715_02990 [Streptomyces spiralis]|uniref:Integral membrane protein n=1 Tax=Streptomyces spiralis TaxID=66376 RepID=A0A918ZHH0_9ACTN|nr:hypothetical protein [Streptomyces spiralis]GHE53519.1 hypothetical protein GCM10014715_02990 [Streptomyces spiralis]